MRTLLSIAALCIIALIFIPNRITAQIPRTISYQGLLAHADGSFIPDGNYSLTLKLYTSATGGSAIFTEVQNAVAVRGIVNVIIGSVTPLPASLAFDRAYFLGITPSGSSELIPRTVLTAVPYALNAAHAIVADGLSTNATGVVTSINEQSGSIRLLGAGGTTITNVGTNFTISSVTGSGSGNFKLPYVDSAFNNAGPIFEIKNNGTTNSTIIGVAHKGSSLSTLTNSAIAGDAGFGYNGVSGYSNGGSNTFAGLLGQGLGNANGIMAIASSADAVNAMSLSGRAGFFQTSGGSANALEVTDSGNGMGLKALSINNIGVRGETTSPTSPAVDARYSGAGVGVALQVFNGALKVGGVNPTAFVHTATTLNSHLYFTGSPNNTMTEIDNPICNGDPNAIVMVTQYGGSIGNQPNQTVPLAILNVVYNTVSQKWEILAWGTQISNGNKFFVLVIKQ